MGVKSIKLARQASQVIKLQFNSFLLCVVYNTKYPLNGIGKYAPHELSNVVYVVFSCHCGSDYVDCTSQQFHVRQEQHVTKTLKKIHF